MDNKEIKSRGKTGMLVGFVGLVLNVLLGAGKLTVGLISGSVSIMSDAANNLSDAGNSLVTVSSFALASKKADKEHPYGHGRYEYIASLIIGVAILMVGFQFALTSIEKIIRPVATSIDLIAFIVLGVSVAVKLAMFIFYRIKGKKIKSDTLKAASFDSFSDCLVTGSIMVCLLIQPYIPFVLDGYLGLIVSLVIVIGGIKVLLETISRLLGTRCDKELYENLNNLCMCNDLIIGTHDLRVHDYGPNRMVASVHVEFSKDIHISEAHSIIDDIEKRAHRELNVELVVHCDPLVGGDRTLSRVRHTIKDIIRNYEGASMHDLSLNYEKSEVIFHIKLDNGFIKEKEYIIEQLKTAVNQIMADVTIQIEVDIIYN